MSNVARRWTPDRVRTLMRPEQPWPRYECVDGELLVTSEPTFLHQGAVIRLLDAFEDSIGLSDSMEVLVSPSDLQFGANLIQPDIFVIPIEAGRRPSSWEEIRSLLLVIEVLSPATHRADRHLKRKLYQRERVPDYWVVDTELRQIELWHPESSHPEVVSDRIAWHPYADGQPQLTLDLPRFFWSVIGDNANALKPDARLRE
jgi:Uma2 family endonuclease